jgi:hypothetical protein
VEQALRRAERYWYEDGLVELGVGFVFLLIGGLFLVAAFTHEGTWVAIGLPVIVLGGAHVSRRLVRRAKERWVFPRTGLVEFRPARPVFRAAAALLALGIAVFLQSFVPVLKDGRAELPLTGLVVAAGLAWFGFRGRIGRFLVVAACSLAVAGAAARLPSSAGNAVFFGGVGLALALSGGFALARYLKEPRP